MNLRTQSSNVKSVGTFLYIVAPENHITGLRVPSGSQVFVI